MQHLLGDLETHAIVSLLSTASRVVNQVNHLPVPPLRLSFTLELRTGVSAPAQLMRYMV